MSPASSGPPISTRVKRGPTRDERTPDPAVQEAIDRYRRTMEEALAEADRY